MVFFLPTNMSFLTIRGKLAEGGFGTIYIGQKTGGIDDGKTYAIKKIIPKSKFDVDHKMLCKELDMFKLVLGIPFFIQLKYAYETVSEYYFIMDYMEMGDLFSYVIGSKIQLTLKETIVCSAEIVLAIQFLHEHQVIHRDLKLENILIGADGHVLLTDFGLTHKVPIHESIRIRCGTPPYFSPEVVSYKPQSYESDWWSLGILIHEFLTGHSPFLLSTNESIPEKLLLNRIKIWNPIVDKLIRLNEDSTIVKDLILKLLIKNPKQRLGFGMKGYDAVKKHPFFEPLLWEAVKLKEYPCLERNLRAQNIEIDNTSQSRLFFNEPKDHSQAEFYYIAPELQKNNVESFLGFTKLALKHHPKNIPILKEVHSVQLKVDQFMETLEVREYLKRFIPRKKTLRFLESTSQATPIRTRNRRRGIRTIPYQLRRSKRIARKRSEWLASTA